MISVAEVILIFDISYFGSELTLDVRPLDGPGSLPALPASLSFPHSSRLDVTSPKIVWQLACRTFRVHAGR